MWGSRSALLRRGLALRRRERLRWYSTQKAVLEDAAAAPITDEEFLGALVGVMPKTIWETQKHVGQ